MAAPDKPGDELLPVAAVGQAQRRRAQRRRPRTNVCVECRKGALGLGPNLCLEFRDLSETGLRFLTKVPLKKKDEVEVAISGHGMRGSIKRMAEVRWVEAVSDQQFLVGLEFQKLIPFRDVHSLTAPDQV